MSTPPPLPALKKSLIWPYASLGAASLLLFAWLVLKPAEDNFEQPKQDFKSHPVRLQLSDEDRSFYAEASLMALLPSVIMAVEKELADQLGQGEVVLDRNPIYSGIMQLSAQRITQLPRKGVDRRLVKAAAEYRLARLDEATLVAQLQLPDMKVVGTKMLVEFLIALAPNAQGQGRTAGEAFQSTLASGLTSAADSVKALSATAESVQRLEMSLIDGHTGLLKALSPEETLGIPSYYESMQAGVARLEANAKKAGATLGKKELTEGLVGKRSAKMEFEFEPGEIRELTVVSQTARGHCLITKVKVGVVSRFLKEYKEAEFRLVHSTLVDGPPALLLVE
jgi:hypothetical protein